MNPRRRPNGFTLIEMLMVVVIISLMAGMAFPLYSYLLLFAKNAQCVANMRALHPALVAYMQDHDSIWPQVPDSTTNEADINKFWLDTLRPYGPTQKTWLCPADPVQQQFANSNAHTFVSSYTVTPFDGYPNTAFNWYQPWVVEKYENHGNARGQNILYPDGSVKAGMSLFSR